jgi:predicted  nucleic acid-binding Zn-ribbon protein
MIAGKQNLQPDMIRVYETNLPRVLSLTDAISIRDSLSTSLPLFAVRSQCTLVDHTNTKQPHMQERTISALLLTILKASISPTSVREVATMQAVVTELTTVFPECPQLRSNVVAALSSEDLQSTIQRFLHVDVEGPEYSGAQVCKPFAAAMHRALVSATISLILASLLGFGSVARSLPESLGLTLLKKHEQLPFIPDRCDHTAAVRSIPSVSLFQQECTPLSGVHLQDWRERLESELQNQSYYARDSVVRSVLQICHDLESRCQTVEEPLRQEKEKSNRLEGELCELRERLAAVELKRWEDGEHLAALDSENEKLEQEKEHLSEMLARLRQDFDNANTKADETLREAREQYRTAEVQLRSTVLAREDEIRLRKQEIQELHAAVASCGDEVGRTKLVVEAQQQNIQAYKQEIQQLHTAKQALSDNYDESRERLGVLNLKHDDLRVELADTTRLIELEREKTAASTSEIDELKSKDRELKTHLQDTKSELTNVVKRLEDAQNRHQELAQSSAEALKDSKRQFDRAKSKAAEEHNRLNADLQEALRNGRDVSEAYEEVQRQLAELQSAVPPLEAKIEELANVRLDQEEEIEGLRAWKSRVMDSMGFPPEPPRRAALGPNTELGDPRTPHQHRRRQSAIQMQTRDVAPKGPSAMQAISSTAIENVANASSTSSESHFSQSGSTPKRARPRHQFKVPSMHTPYNKKPLVTSKSVSRKLSPTKRSILRPISPNRRHTTVGFAIAEDEEEQELTQDLPMRKRRGSLQDAGQADFNMDEFVAGTPLTPGAFTSGTGRIVDEDGSVTEL